ncbi:hypothetical protein [Edaphobacter albus]|uniref:hypothetical protein n=1 Tax=Edaphobacter sp. 4G125 TaxID=2763071 RepID=UPI001645121A|nr:hypothetical protein [Edaphobacter sp. 4G125]QNI35370.1 hypothetical protein H7846_09720 [Edaphobacter sp. 4G125]
MQFTLRISVLLLFLVSTCIPSRAADKITILDEQQLLQLEQRAEQANPRDQCFLYTELVSAMTEIAGQQLKSDNPSQATATLNKIAKYAQLIQVKLSRDTKRLKNAEQLMHRTTYKLNEYLHSASYEDRPTLQATLKQLNQVQSDILTQVFNH